MSLRDKIKLNMVNESVEKNMLLLRDLTKKEATTLLNADFSYLEDIDHYKNLDKGINMLLNTIDDNELIAIQVDPDADGMFSGALSYLALYDDFEYDNVTYILNDGKQHNFQLDKMDALLKSDVKLLIIPDGGSVEVKPLEKLIDNKIKILVLDHHEIDSKVKKLSEENEFLALINNQDGSVENVYGSGTLVTYKFFKEVFDSCDINIKNKYLDLVACSIVSDLCNLKYSYENRCFLNIGSRVNNVTNPFLVEICNSLKKRKNDRLTIEDMGFTVAPIINTTIRLGTLEEKTILFNALIGTDEEIIHRKKPTTYPNKARLVGASYQRNQREYVKNTTPIIEKKIRELGLDKNNVIVYIDGEREIDPSLRGLLANKLLDIFEKPILIGTKSFDKISGSARGYGELEFKDICESTECFEWLRGHNGAFGFCIKESNLEDFISKINELDISSGGNIITIEHIYENGDLPTMGEVKSIAKYEDLWCSQIQSPKYYIEKINFRVEDIEKKGNATYIFKNDKIHLHKYFGAKDWFEDLVCEMDEDGNRIKGEDGECIKREEINVNAIVEFRYKYGAKIIIDELELISWI